MSGRLAGRTALLTGAGGGIGGAGAAALAHEGARVACTDLVFTTANVVAGAIQAGGGDAFALALDVTDRAAVDAAVAHAEQRLGGLDVLVACAGISRAASFLDTTAEDWARVLAVNLTGVFHVAQAAARGMVARGSGGSIVVITSQLAEVARADRAAYIASKGGARMLVKAMAVELAPHGIRVNAVAPGPTLTGLTRERYEDPAARERTEQRIPLGRLGQPEDIAGAIVFLASDESRWMTGSTVTVDGGYLAW